MSLINDVLSTLRALHLKIVGKHANGATQSSSAKRADLA